MKSQALPRFWKLYRQLPKSVRRRAARVYRVWQHNPELPGLQFKRVSDKRPVYSVRIGDYYRALGLVQADTITWFWIGDHQEYDQLLKQM